jgi:N-methylhydantoinase B/oxoprolinase/acetone carboxylase alpha subunit
MTKKQIPTIDPITIEVVNNALAAIAEEITINLARTAHTQLFMRYKIFVQGC